MSNSLLKGIPCLVLGSFLFLHYYLQNQLNHNRLAIEGLKEKIFSMKNVRDATQNNTWALFKKARSNQKELKQFLQTSWSSQPITIQDIKIENGKFFLIARSDNLNSGLAFAHRLQHFVIKSIKWDVLSHSAVFQMSSNTGEYAKN